jgi:hypothetical protein
VRRSRNFDLDSTELSFVNIRLCKPQALQKYGVRRYLQAICALSMKGSMQIAMTLSDQGGHFLISPLLAPLARV